MTDAIAPLLVAIAAAAVIFAAVIFAGLALEPGGAQLRRLWRASIWHPDAIPADEGKVAADVKRRLLPAYDVVLIAAALLAIRGGMPSFVIVYNETVSDVAARALLVAATSCLIGMAFPRLWRLEVAAKIALTGIILAYSVMLLGTSVGEPARGFVGGLGLAVCLLPSWRIKWLGEERRKRRKGKGS